MLSQLFHGDPVLQAVLDDQDRISRTQHATEPVVGKVQTALLIWDPTCLPNDGADSKYGDETAGAVVRFKAEVLGVPPDEIFDDVGPLTVERLDQIAAAAESAIGIGALVVVAPGLTPDDHIALSDEIAQAGGEVLLGLGEIAAVVAGGQQVIDSLAPLVGQLVAGIVTPANPELPSGLDEDAANLLGAWLAMLDPSYLAAHSDPARFGTSFEFLGGCAQEVVL